MDMLWPYTSGRRRNVGVSFDRTNLFISTIINVAVWQMSQIEARSGLHILNVGQMWGYEQERNVVEHNARSLMCLALQIVLYICASQAVNSARRLSAECQAHFSFPQWVTVAVYAINHQIKRHSRHVPHGMNTVRPRVGHLAPLFVRHIPWNQGVDRKNPPDINY